METEAFIEFPVGQQSAIAGQSCAVKFQSNTREGRFLDASWAPYLSMRVEEVEEPELGAGLSTATGAGESGVSAGA